MLTIRKMEATFGKLDGDTLELTEGLNVISAPNEWGKSTWCAFLTAMLYGVDTRDRTTKTGLADKEHYAPWSGKPMSGRLEADWNGRRIVLYRSTSGRIPMGVFQAFDAETGLPVSELTAANCGEMLLGVEKSVFLRSNFIRQGDMPVDADDNLRRRLHSLVVSGEDGSGNLADRLRELKNRLRYRKSGLLPQAEEELEEVHTQAKEAAALSARLDALQQELSERRSREEELENHLRALQCQAWAASEERIQSALTQLDECQAAWQQAKRDCDGLAPREEIRQKLDRAWALQETRLPEVPECAPAPEPAPDEGQVENARMAAESLEKRSPVWILPALAALLLAAAGAMAFFRMPEWKYVCGAAIAAAAGYCWLAVSRSRRKREILRRYGGDPRQWLDRAEERIARQKEYAAYLQTYEEKKREAEDARRTWQKELDELTEGVPLGEYLSLQRRAMGAWQREEETLREYNRQSQVADMLQQMRRPAPEPAGPDTRTESEEETRRLLRDLEARQQQLLEQTGLLRGRLSHLPDRQALEQKQMALQKRIWHLEDCHRAVELGLETARETETAMSSRFAPRISRQAGQYLKRLTCGRYSALQLQQDLSLLAAAEGENSLRSPLWRSSGTADQLYLAVRLAVAEALSPETPLVLDDAFTRFDDERLRSALALLEEMPRQVILFTCQERENTLKNQRIPGKNP
ncbi:MAG: AAA family ATPase [Firmicutes bacterium]|nr:AAA family ATPase [Bacillota bacterium]